MAEEADDKTLNRFWVVNGFASPGASIVKFIIAYGMLNRQISRIKFCPKERRGKGFSEMIKRTMNRQINKSNAVVCRIGYNFQRVRKIKGVKYEKSLQFLIH